MKKLGWGWGSGWIWICVILLGGCAGKKTTTPGGMGAAATPRAKQIEPEARNAFFQAERAFTTKNYEQALRLYASVKNRFPRGRAGLLSSYRLGTIHYYEEDYAAASREFEFFLQKYPNSDLAFDVTYNLAAAQYQLGEYDKAQATLAKLRAADVQSQGARRAELVYQLSAQVAGAQGNHVGVVSSYAAELQLPIDERTRADLEDNIDTHLARIDTRPELERLAGEVTEASTKAKIQARLAALAGSAPEVEPGKPGVPPVATGPAPLEGPGGTGERFSVGVILPLTGKFATYGKRALDGILLAAKSYASARDIDLKVYVEDSGGNPAQAQIAVDSLYQQHKIMAIIGPINWKESLAVADRAQALGIPNLSLSAKEGISEHGQYLFQNALTPRVQLDNLVRYCVNEKKFSRFAILAPNNPYGKDLANQFWDIVEKYGAHVVAYQNYSPDEKDFQSEIKELTGLANLKFRRVEVARMAEYVAAQKAKTRREPKVHLPPAIDFDALFIPDSPKAGAQIGASMAYFDANVALLGTTEWNSGELYKRGGKAVEGAIFPGGVSTATRNARQRDFIRLYSDAYGAPPELLSSLAYEAMELVATSLKKSGSGDRNDLANTLAGLRDFETPLGNLSFDQTRIAQRKIPIYTLENGGGIVEE